MTALTNQRRRTLPPLPRQLLDEQIGFALLVWAGYVAFVLIVVIGVATWREVTMSAWDQARQAAQWFALFIGAYVGWQRLPLQVTHGRTRREFMGQALIFVPLYAAALALMVAVTYLAEAGLYRLAGWPQAIEEYHLFDSPLEFHLVFLESWLLVALWTAGGVFTGSAWYRGPGVGGWATGMAIVVAGVSGIVFSTSWGPFGFVYEWLTGEQAVSAPIGVLLHLACIAVVLWLAWLVVRDIPIRNKTN